MIENPFNKILSNTAATTVSAPKSHARKPNSVALGDEADLEKITIFAQVHKENMLLQSRLGRLDRDQLDIRLQALESNNATLALMLAQTQQSSNMPSVCEEEEENQAVFAVTISDTPKSSPVVDNNILSTPVQSPREDMEFNTMAVEPPDYTPDRVNEWGDSFDDPPSSPFGNFIASSPLQNSFKSMRKSGRFSVRGRLSLDLLNIRGELGTSHDRDSFGVGDDCHRRRQSLMFDPIEEDPAAASSRIQHPVSSTNMSLSPALLDEPVSTDIVDVCTQFLEFYSISLDAGILSGQSKFEPGCRQLASAINFVYPQPANGQTPIVESIGDFCFPNGLSIEVRNECELMIPSEKYFFERKDSFHVMQFSDAAGSPTYGTCLTYYDKVNLSEPSAFVDNVNQWRKEAFSADVIKCFLLRVIEKNKRRTRAASTDSSIGQGRLSRKRTTSSSSQQQDNSAKAGGNPKRSVYTMLKNSLWRRRQTNHFSLKERSLSAGSSGKKKGKRKTSVMLATLDDGSGSGLMGDCCDSDASETSSISDSEISYTDVCSPKRTVLKEVSGAADAGAETPIRRSPLMLKPLVEYAFIPRALCILTSRSVQSLVMPILNHVRLLERSSHDQEEEGSFTVNNETMLFLEQCFHFKFPDSFPASDMHLYGQTSRIPRPFTSTDELQFPLFVIESPHANDNDSPAANDHVYFNLAADFIHFQDWTLGLLFAMLPAVDVVKLLNVLLLEGSVAVCGTNVGVVSTISSALSYLIHPFHWEGVFIPLIPPNALEILDSPVPFIAGTTHIITTAELKASTCQDNPSFSGDVSGASSTICLSSTAAVLYVDDYGSEGDVGQGVTDPTAAASVPPNHSRYKGRSSAHDKVAKSGLSPSSHRRYLVLPSEMKVHDVDIELCQQIEYLCNHYRLKSLYQRLQVVEELSAEAKYKIDHLLDDLTSQSRASLFDAIDEPKGGDEPKAVRERPGLSRSGSSNSHHAALWHDDEVVLSSLSSLSNCHVEVSSLPSTNAVTELKGSTNTRVHTPEGSSVVESGAPRKPIMQPFSLLTFLRCLRRRGSGINSSVPEDSTSATGVTSPSAFLIAVQRLRKVIIRHNYSLTGELCLHSHNWKKFGSYQISYHDNSRRYHFFPQWLIEPLKDKLEFQRKMVGTQLFSSFVHAVQEEYHENESYRLFLADWIYFRWVLRSRRSLVGAIEAR